MPLGGSFSEDTHPAAMRITSPAGDVEEFRMLINELAYQPGTGDEINPGFFS